MTAKNAKTCERCGEKFIKSHANKNVCNLCDLRRNEGRVRMPFRKLCIRCGEMFTRNGKYQKICDDCRRGTGRASSKCQQ